MLNRIEHAKKTGIFHSKKINKGIIKLINKVKNWMKEERFILHRFSSIDFRFDTLLFNRIDIDLANFLF
jgi:hypothetical protein